MKRVWIKKGKDKKIRNFYPWIFRDEIERKEGKIEDGEIVELLDSDGNFLGKGFWSNKSHIALRIFDREGEDFEDVLKKRFDEAIKVREKIKETNSFRFFYSEGDGIPGLIVDKYDKTIVFQSRIKGIDNLKKKIIEKLIELFNPSSIYERSDGEFRAEEGLDNERGLLYGNEPYLVKIEERGLKFLVDVKEGMKTGFYLDQRDNRKRVEEIVEEGMECLDLFSYTGAFSLFLARKGAKVKAVEIEEKNLELGRENAKLNSLSSKVDFISCNAYDFLEEEVKKGRRFDFIIADPPGIVKRKSDVEKGKWAYWKILYNSFKIGKKGSIVLISSCSYHISLQTLLEMAKLSASDAGVKVKLLDITFQPIDHPWIIQIPETLYLKSLFLRIES
jgi:23S rRNA (cytosine1962-C5)-methyltransferase